MLDHQQQRMSQSKSQELSLSNKQSQQKTLPPIPDKIYFTIGEAGALCLVKPHVLRYWEQEFPQLKPNKRRGNRRYYQRDEILLIRRIKSLLYYQGFTIEGARAKLNDISDIPTKTSNISAPNLLNDIISGLRDILTDLERY